MGGTGPGAAGVPRLAGPARAHQLAVDLPGRLPARLRRAGRDDRPRPSSPRTAGRRPGLTLAGPLRGGPRPAPTPPPPRPRPRRPPLLAPPRGRPPPPPRALAPP